jgi:L-fuconolactonase
MSSWLADLARVASQPNTCCKLSGLLTELPEDSGTGEVTASICYLFQLFGPDRLVWGSDWPVLTLAGEYGSWIELCCDELERYGTAAKDAVMGGNARRIYKLALN